MKFTTKQKWVVSITLGLFFLLIGLIVFWLTNVNETRKTSDNNITSVGVLECKSARPINAFFDSQTATSAEQKIKITFKDDKADKISYDYVGTYDNDKQASDDRTTFAIKYDLELGENKNKQKSLTANFSASGNTARITIYTEQDNLNADIAKFFFLGQNEYKDVGTLSADTLKRLYQGKGFTCNNTK